VDLVEVDVSHIDGIGRLLNGTEVRDELRVEGHGGAQFLKLLSDAYHHV